MSKARQQANLSSDGNLFADISNDRVGVGSVVPTHKLHVNGTSKFDDDVKFEGTTAQKFISWDKSADALKVSDDGKITFGDSTDLSIYHTTSGTSWIRHANTSEYFVIEGQQIDIRDYTTSKYRARFGTNVELRYDNTPRFETTNTGAKVTGNLEVTGVLTYDDVTSIDSVGIVTARANVHIAEWIAHIGDLNTTIGFPSNDTITFNTSSNERLRIDSSGNITQGIAGSATFSSVNSIAANAARGIEIHKDGTDTGSAIKLAGDNGSGTKAWSQLGYSGANGTAHWANYNTSGTKVGEIVITATAVIQCKGETDVQNSIFRVTDGTPRIIMSVPSGGLDTRLFNDGSGNFIIGHGTNSDAPPERLRIDANGKIGVGIAPNAWQSSTTSKLIQIGNSSVWDYDLQQFDLGQNFYYDGSNYKYIANGYATKLSQLKSDGSFIFYQSSISGTGGNNLTWYEKLRLNWGTSGHNGTVDVRGIPAHLRLNSLRDTSDWDSGDPIGKFDFYVGSDTTNNLPYTAGFIHCLNEVDNVGEPSGALVFGTTTANLSGGAVERMRITDDGSVNIGTAGAGYSIWNGLSSDVGVKLQVRCTVGEPAGMALLEERGDSNGASFIIGKSRYGNGVGAITSGDTLGWIKFAGADGTRQHNAAGILVYNSGTIATGRVAGNMSLYTAPDAVSGMQERIRITSAGNCQIQNGGRLQIVSANNGGQTGTLFMIGSQGTGETRAIDMMGGWSTNESKSITWSHGNTNSDMIAQMNVQYYNPGSQMNWGKFYHGGNSSTYTMALKSSSSTAATLQVTDKIIVGDPSDTQDYSYATAIFRHKSARSATAGNTGWPYWLPLDNNRTQHALVHVTAGGNGGTATGGTGPIATMVFGEYYDSAALITVRGGGSASPSDQGQGHGKDLMVAASNSDNTNGKHGGRLFLQSGSGYSSGAFHKNHGETWINQFGGDVHIGGCNNEEQKVVQHAYPNLASTTATVVNEQNGEQWEAKYVTQQGMSNSNDQAWYKYEFHGGYASRAHNLDLWVTWTTSHASPSGCGRWHIGVWEPHGGHFGINCKRQYFMDFNAGGTYYTWGIDPSVYLYRGTMSGSGTSSNQNYNRLYFAVRGRIGSNPNYGGGLRHCISCTVHENNYRGNPAQPGSGVTRVQNKFEYVGETTPSDVGTFYGWDNLP